MAKEGQQEPCTCASCQPINTEVVCQQFAQTASRYNDQSAHAAAASLNTQQNLQAMFNVKAQQTLEHTAGERQSSMLALLGSVNSRIAGIEAKVG